MELHDFIEAFEREVEPWIESETGRWASLISQCRGDAAETLKACAFIPQAHRYKAAKNLLRQKYGESEVVEQAWMDHLQQQAPSLEKLSVSLDAAVRALSKTPAKGYADYHLTLHLIQKGFPEALQRKWGVEVLKLREKGEAPTLAFMAEVVRKFAAREQQWKRQKGLDRPSRLRTQPQQDCQKKNWERRQPTHHPSSSSSACYAVSSPSDCPVCHGDYHPLDECRTLKDMSVRERYEAVTRVRACYKCLEYGHIANQCDNQCSECQGRHHFLLHRGEHTLQSADTQATTTQLKQGTFHEQRPKQPPRTKKTWPPKDKRPGNASN